MNDVAVLDKNSVLSGADRADLCVMKYERAIDAAVASLQEAKDSLSLETLDAVDVSIEALTAWGRLDRDDLAKQLAREALIAKMIMAVWIAEKIVERDKPVYLFGQHKTERLLGPFGVLRRYGWTPANATAAIRLARASAGELRAVKASKKVLRYAAVTHITKHSNKATNLKSDAWHKLYFTGYGGVALSTCASPMQRVDAKQLAEEFEDKEEIILARRSVTQVRDWCDKFLKALPKVKA